MPLSRVCSTVSTSPRRTVTDRPWLIFTPASAAVAPDFFASARTCATASRSRESSAVTRDSRVRIPELRFTVYDSRLSSAHGQAVDPERRLAHAHRHALAFLAASADARVELQIAADHGHAREHVRSVADQGRAPCPGRG